MKQKGSILALDWGKKYIGCAYALEGSSIVFPIGYILNDKSILGSLGDIVNRYRVKQIIIWVPSNEWVRWQVEHFAKTIAGISNEHMVIELLDEDYTSVQAGEKVNNFQKNVAEDTLAAMIILERWIAEQQQKNSL